MSSKKLATEQTASDIYGISVDLNMSNAKLGATLRGLLEKLKPPEVVTIVPEPGPKSGKHWYGVMYRRQNHPMTDVFDYPPELKNLSSKNMMDSVIDWGGQKEDMSVGNELDLAILAAEERGKAAVSTLVDSEKMLSTTEVAERIEISRQAVGKRRNNGQILALKAGPKILRYPHWQILPTGEVVAGIKDVLRRFDGDAWAAYRFLKEMVPDGSDQPFYELLRDGDIATVLAHIDGNLGGAVT